MSINIGGFFSKVKSVFKNLFAAEPTVAQQVNFVVKLCSPIVYAIIAKTAGEGAASLVDAGIKEAMTDLAVVTTTIQSSGLSGNNPANIATSLQAVNDNLNGLLAAGHIKDPAKLASVTSDVKFVTDEINAVLSVVQTIKAPAPTA